MIFVFFVSDFISIDHDRLTILKSHYYEAFPQFISKFYVSLYLSIVQLSVTLLKLNE